MIKSLRLYIVVFIILLSYKVLGQVEVSKYPVRFSQYYSCSSLINPGMAGTSKDVEMAAGNKRLSGSLKGISTYYFNADVRLEKKTRHLKTPFSVLGLFLYNDKEGKYLNRTRFYLTYAWHGNLTSNVRFSGGFHFGGLNYNVKGTELSGGGSDIAPDGSVGIQFYNKKFHVAASYNQFFNSELSPINEVTRLSSYSNLSGDYLLSLTSKVNMQGFVCLMLKDGFSNYLVDYSLLFDYSEIAAGSIGIHNNNNIIFSLEGRNIFQQLKGLNLAITYGVPLKSVGITTAFFEIGLKYSFTKGELK